MSVTEPPEGPFVALSEADDEGGRRHAQGLAAEQAEGGVQSLITTCAHSNSREIRLRRYGRRRAAGDGRAVKSHVSAAHHERITKVVPVYDELGEPDPRNEATHCTEIDARKSAAEVALG